MNLIIAGTLYAALTARCLVVIIFGGLGLVPDRSTARAAVAGTGPSRMPY
jgi:hypothetical protein